MPEEIIVQTKDEKGNLLFPYTYTKAVFTKDKQTLEDVIVTKEELTTKGYLTQHQDISSKADKSEIPTKLSSLTNDVGYITTIPSGYITEDELTAKGYLTSHQDISGKANISDVYTKSEIDTKLDGIEALLEEI